MERWGRHQLRRGDCLYPPVPSASLLSTRVKLKIMTRWVLVVMLATQAAGFKGELSRRGLGAGRETPSPRSHARLQCRKPRLSLWGDGQGTLPVWLAHLPPCTGASGARSMPHQTAARLLVFRALEGVVPTSGALRNGGQAVGHVAAHEFWVPLRKPGSPQPTHSTVKTGGGWPSWAPVCQPKAWPPNRLQSQSCRMPRLLLPPQG